LSDVDRDRTVPSYLAGQEVVGVGEVHAGGRDVVDLLARSGCGFGDVDDVQDLGTAEAGDLHGSHAGEATDLQFPSRLRSLAVERCRLSEGEAAARWSRIVETAPDHARRLRI
jgi:hypothetical protein